MTTMLFANVIPSVSGWYWITAEALVTQIVKLVIYEDGSKNVFGIGSDKPLYANDLWWGDRVPAPDETVMCEVE